jgi:hypothetical protein
MLRTKYITVWTQARDLERMIYSCINQADVSIVHPCLLRDVLPADSPVTVNGIGGNQLKAEHTAY